MVFVINVFMGERFEVREEFGEVLYEECGAASDDILGIANFVQDEINGTVDVKKLPSLRTLGEIYGFKPYFLRDEKLNLNFDISDFMRMQILQGMARFDEIDAHHKEAKVIRKNYMRSVDVPLFIGAGGALELMINKTIVHYFDDDSFVDKILFWIYWPPRPGSRTLNRFVGELILFGKGRRNMKNGIWFIGKLEVFIVEEAWGRGC